MMPMKRASFLHFLPILGIILISMTLRSLGLDSESVWYDEAASWSTATNSISGIWSDRTFPPFYHLLLHFWLQVGHSEFVLRLPSVFFGVLSVAAIYQLGRKLCNNEIGLLSAFLLTISPLHLRYSQEARMYIPLMFFTIASSYFFWNAWHEGNRSNWTAYVIFSMLNLYTHYFAISVWLAHNLFALTWLIFHPDEQNAYRVNERRNGPGQQGTIDQKLISIGKNLKAYLLIVLNPIPHLRNPENHRLRYWIISQFSILLLVTPCLVKLLLYHNNGMGGVLATVFGGSPNVRTPLDIAISFSLGPGVRSLLPILVRRGIYVLISVSCLLGVFNIKREHDLRSLSLSASGMFILTCFVAPIVAVLGALWCYKRTFSLRYVVAFLPFFHLMISAGILNIPKASLQIAAVFALTAVSIFGLRQEYMHDYKENWREATRYIVSHWQEGDALCFVPAWEKIGFRYYAGYDFDYAIQQPPPVYDPEQVANALQDPRWSQYERMWLVQGLNSHKAVDPEQAIKSGMDKYWHPLDVQKFRGIGKIVLYSIPDPGINAELLLHTTARAEYHKRFSTVKVK